MRIGLDPEVAIVHKETGAGRSAHRFIKQKEQYEFFYDYGPRTPGNGRLGSEVERDGAAIEVRSIIPSACRDNIIPYIAEALRQQQLKLNEKWNGEYTLSSTPVFELQKDDLVKTTPKDVFEFGCRPDLDAYTLATKDPQLPPNEMRRFTGGHIHYSTMGAKQDIEQQAALAILFDYFVSLPMVAILGDQFAAGEADRRQYYGQPGSFRYDDQLDKIEFRTLSGRMLLHPTILYWVLGAMKMAVAAVPSPRNYMAFVKDKLVPGLPPQQVFDIIMNHDVAAAEKAAADVFKLLPTYKENKNDLANPMSGGGAGTKNPYFYEQSMNVFVQGNRDGVTFRDDMTWNWGLYDGYEPKHHAYWGIQQAMVGLLDNDIFPYNEVLKAVWPKDLIQKKHVYTHPVNGGDKQYVKAGAAAWLA